jgi:uncharacterized membrane protein
MSILGVTHMTAASLALISGAVALGLPGKGNARHRLLGWIYVSMMLLLNGTALLIYHLFGQFGPFHVAAVVSLFGVVGGTLMAITARRRRERRDRQGRARAVERHFYWMSYSYVGLLAAAVAEAVTRFPGTRRGGAFALAVAVASAGVIRIRGFFIWRRAKDALAEVGTAYTPSPVVAEVA